MKRITVLLVIFSVLVAMCVGCNNANTDPLSNNTDDLTDTKLEGTDNAGSKPIDTSSPADSNNHADVNNPPSSETYTLLLYDNMLGGMDDTITKRASDRIMENKRLKNTEKLPNRTESVFDRTFTFTFDETRSSKRWVNNRDDFTYTDVLTGSLVMASFDSATGALLSYTNGDAGFNREYQSAVNDKSSETEFLTYAKGLVSPHNSIDKCEVEISTEIFEYDASDGNYYSKKMIDGYVNNTDNDPNFYAVYHITFYKTIDGIRRFDTNVIEINNTGEIHRARFNMQDELYADFVDEDIDMEQAERLVRGALEKFIPTNSTVEIVPSVVATNDGNLWLHLETFVGYDGATSGYIYVIQLSSTVEG